MKIVLFDQVDFLTKNFNTKPEIAENPLKSKRTKTKTMVQNQPKVITRNWLLLLLFAAFLPTFTFGQTSVTIGATSGSSHFVYGPYYRSSATSSFNYSKYAYLYTASELGIPAGSNITKVEWLKKSGTINGSNTFNVWMKNASSSSLTNNSTWNSLVASASQVYSSTSQSFAAANDSWEEVNLSSSFTYNGGSLQIMTDFSFTGTASAANNYYVNAATGKALGWATTTPISGTMTLTSGSYGDNRPTIRITYTSGSACSGTPTAGSAISSVSSAVCSGSSVELNLSGNSVGSGMSYQWQESSNNSTWSNLGTSSSLSTTTVTPTSSKYYRAIVTCGANSSTSSSVHVTVTPALAAGTYTINSSLATSGSNYHSFTDFANALSCSISGPIVVNVAAGTYNEQFKLGEVAGTSATNTITINGNNATISYVSISSTDRGVITLNGTDYVTINALNITSSSSSTTDYGWGVFITNNADHNTINGCTISLSTTNPSADFAGIVVSGSSQSASATGSNCDSITISNNTINGGYYGISLVGNTSTTTNGHVISNNTVKDFYLYGIYAGGINTTSIYSNNINRATRTANFNSFYGIWVYGNSTNVTVYKNKIHDPATLSPQSSFSFYGIGFSNAVSSGNMVYNNILYNLQGNGEQNSLYNNASDVKWYYNSIASDYTANSGGDTRGFYQLNASSTNSTISFKNNNISITRTGASGTRSCVEIKNNSANISKSNNNYFGSSSVNCGILDGTLYSSLSSWQSATSDNGSVSVNPTFESASSGNLKPTSFALNNTGIVVSGVTTDYTSNVRSVSTPDIGAYEFNVNSCSGTPSIPVFNPTTLTACSGVSFGMSLVSFPTGGGITYQWQSSPAALSNFTDISGATLPTYTATQTSATKYRVIATCSSSSSTSNVVTVNMSASSLCYCASYAVGSDDGDITSVTFGSLSNTSTCTSTGGSGSMQNLYADYTGSVTAANVTIGSKVPVTIGVGSCANSNNGYVKAYIDFNIDGDFDDAGEEVFVSDAFVTTNGTSVSGIITIPSGLTAGNTRMRVVMSETNDVNSITPCGTYSTGETEDYAITLTSNVGTVTAQPSITSVVPASTSIKYTIMNGTGTGVSGTFFVVTESDSLNFDPINYTSYSCATTGTSVTFDNNLIDVSNGKAAFLSTGKNGKSISLTVKGLRSGIKYYLYAYTFSTASGGRVYNSRVSVDATTTIIAPTLKSVLSDVVTDEIGANSAVLRWKNGGGAGRIVVLSKTTLSSTAPTNDASYSGNESYGNGDVITATNFVVRTISNYAPNEFDSVIVTNLESGAKYAFTVYEFNGEQGVGQTIKYSTAATKKQFTTNIDFVTVSKSLIGVGYSQDFATMDGTNQLPIGWHATSSVSEDNGSSSSAGIKNYGSTASSDRSLGSIGDTKFGVRLKNGTSGNGAITWTSVLVKYTGKQWRNGDATNEQLTLQYSLDAYTFTDANQYMSNSAATWNNASSNLTFTAPTSSPNNSMLDGDATQNSVVKIASIVDNIPAQSYIWIRWVNSAGATVNDGLAIDNVEVIPFSETATTTIAAGSKTMGLNIVGNATASGDLSIKNVLNIESGVKLDLTGSTNTKLTVNGKLYGTGTIASDDDILTIGGSSLNQTIYSDASNNTFKTLALKAGSTANLGNSMNISTSVLIDGASLATNDYLVLNSTSSSAAYIDRLKNSGSISGEVTVQLVTSQYPNYRFISHPFTSAIPISQLNDNLSLDVSGGVGQNIWYYDVANSATGTINTSTLSQTSIWTGYNSLSQDWDMYTGIRLFTPANTTLDFHGVVNQNNISVTKTAGASGITIVGNPYPAPLKLSATNVASGVSSVYLWNPNTNSGQGSWTTRNGVKIGGNIIPMGSAFVALSNPGATTTWNFTEADKQKSATVVNFFREPNEVDNSISFNLNVNKGTEYLDELSINFDKSASSVSDFTNDAPKMLNPGLDFYTKSADNVSLAVDSRQFVDGTIIPLGIKKASTGKYSITVAEWNNIPSNYNVYLVDNYTNKTVELNASTTYTFNIDNNPESLGEKRFHIQLGKVVNPDQSLTILVSPNPVSNTNQFINIQVNGSNDAKAQVNIVSITGMNMISKEIESIAHGQIQIPVNQLSAGVYFAEVIVNGNKVTKKFIKE